MSAAIQDELHTFATALLERRGSLVDWPSADREGTAVLPPDVAAAVGSNADVVRLASEPADHTLGVNLATEFLDLAGRLLESEPHVGTFRVREIYLKRKDIDEAVQHAFTWLNAKVKIVDARPTAVEYHTWWFHGAISSEERWETQLSLSLNAASGVEVHLPNPLDLWELEPAPSERRAGPSTYDRAAAAARRRLLELAGPFLDRMDARLKRDQKRLSDYYRALLKEADKKKSHGHVPPNPQELEAKKRAVDLELRRKLGELSERYAMEATLTPVVVVRTEVPVLAVDLLVFRKKWHKKHTIYWNPLLKHFEPIGCGSCGKGVFAVAFANETVEPLCRECSPPKEPPS